MIRLVLSLMLAPVAALAEVDASSRTQILAISAEFSTHVLDGLSLEFSLDTMLPAYGERLVTVYGLNTLDDFKAASRSGFEIARANVEVHFHETHPGLAVFGQSGEWIWGIVPYSSQVQRTGEAELRPVSCDGLLVFGKHNVWYTHSIHERSDEYLREAVPEFDFLDDPPPDCVGQS